jgi:hypothetical protein
MSDIADILENALANEEQPEQPDTGQDNQPEQPEQETQDEGQSDTNQDEAQFEANQEESQNDEADQEQSDQEQEDKQEGEGEQKDEQSEPEQPQEKQEPEVQKKQEQPQSVSDEMLRAELERRGMVATKKQDQPQPEDPRFSQPRELPDAVWSRMTEEGKYIYNQLPYLTIRGKDGILRVKSDEQIPPDFEWADEAEKTQFYSKELPAQVYRAEQLNAQVTKAVEDYNRELERQREAQTIVQGVEKLQASGILPKIPGERGSKEYEGSAELAYVNNVLGLWEQHHRQGENISIETAAYLYKAQHPDALKPKPTTTPTDKMRKAKSTNINGGAKGKAMPEQRHTFPPGTMPSDIIDYYLDDFE